MFSFPLFFRNGSSRNHKNELMPLHENEKTTEGVNENLKFVAKTEVVQVPEPITEAIPSFDDKDIYNSDYEVKDISNDSIMSHVQISINADKDTLLGKALNMAEKLSSGGMAMDGSSVVSQFANLAQTWQSLSGKFQEVSSKIEKQKLGEVQGFVESSEMEDTKRDIEPPLGPIKGENEINGAKKGTKTERYNSKKEEGSSPLYKSLLQNLGPAVLAGLGSAKSAKSGTGLLSLLTPAVANLIETPSDNGGDLTMGSVLGLIKGLAPLLNTPADGKPRTAEDNIKILRPVMSVMGPVLWAKMFGEKEEERKYIDEDPFAGGASNLTVVDKMLDGQDEKTVGQVRSKP